jgi:squalene synthase HpnC
MSRSVEQQIPAELEADFAACKKIALGHYENFPVGSVLLPSTIRPHFFALYAFMRTADDFADLPERPASERLRLLHEWREELLKIEASQKSTYPVFRALAFTINRYRLDPTLLHRLLDAFEFDAKGDVRFQTFEDLRWYTARSADPVGRLVLNLFGYRDEKLNTMSDSICTALQLINFVQDAREDLDNRRLYFPVQDLVLASVEPAELMKGIGISEVVRHSMVRIKELLEEGSPLPELVEGRLRYELRAVLLMARRMSEKIARQDYDTYRSRPKLSKFEHLRLLARAFLGPVRF